MIETIKLITIITTIQMIRSKKERSKLMNYVIIALISAIIIYKEVKEIGGEIISNIIIIITISAITIIFGIVMMKRETIEQTKSREWKIKEVGIMGIISYIMIWKTNIINKERMGERTEKIIEIWKNEIYKEKDIKIIIIMVILIGVLLGTIRILPKKEG